ncbi:ferredoxin--NADP reductase [Actinoplanes derwentensis]|uniref:3-ketosteroid 9alpha-monooxygenase subunit B n=1 Tax=Actinoplanes derwentensis TaxID=113562 RepID=A0A1H2B322_9ACTN|nr:ferredoxin--NADP reductase [Actinoplanes derwentensis]GID87574.1 3-ketosteroid-9-alpha-monooxygenase, ferredoxin reductase component [Actinoplanes derwentensis]SDT52369.1 3-ketosteroid 9alpha-monooxygenase subunit B [Actinoplanes derwentensis]
MPVFRPVRVAAVITETTDACSLVLDADLDYLPGQYLTVRTPAGARCYSLASAPGTGEAPRITVKRVAGGQVSNWICDRVRAGDTLDMAGPAGTFTPRSFDDELLLLAGGSGITPIMGIIKSMRCVPVLFYANRDTDSIIFRDELAGLLPVIHWLDREQGVPTADALKELLSPYRSREAFVCGPEPFVAVAEKALQLAGVPAERIRVERFALEPAGGRAAVAEVEIDGRSHMLPWAAGRRLLDVIVDAGLNPPWSCRQGQCGACAVRLVSGEVTLVHNEILEEEDFADGYILACQAVAVSDHVKVTYH